MSIGSPESLEALEAVPAVVPEVSTEEVDSLLAQVTEQLDTLDV